ncbi:hypothetical protein C8R46DRAFT_1238532 [Mycena filopes]|nr:hypothetical protein C8R46DRAFT_1238532 [Mycena filopes]
MSNRVETVVQAQQEHLAGLLQNLFHLRRPSKTSAPPVGIATSPSTSRMLYREVATRPCTAESPLAAHHGPVLHFPATPAQHHPYHAHGTPRPAFGVSSYWNFGFASAQSNLSRRPPTASTETPSGAYLLPHARSTSSASIHAASPVDPATHPPALLQLIVAAPAPISAPFTSPPSSPGLKRTERVLQVVASTWRIPSAATASISAGSIALLHLLRRPPAASTETPSGAYLLPHLVHAASLVDPATHAPALMPHRYERLQNRRHTPPLCPLPLSRAVPTARVDVSRDPARAR